MSNRGPQQPINPYSPPLVDAGSSTDDYVFSADLRNKVLAWTGLGGFFNFVAFPAIFLATASLSFVVRQSAWLAGAGMLLATFILHHCITWSLNFFAYRRMSHVLRRRFLDEGIPVERLRGRFVQFAPTAEPRLYEQFTNWDIGFLFFFPDQLVYIGERIRFALRRDDIVKYWLGRNAAAYTEGCTCLTWSANGGRPVGSLNFESGDAIPLVRLRSIPKLHSEFMRWKEEGVAMSADVDMPAAWEGLSKPALDEIPGKTFQQSHLFRQFVSSVIIFGVLAMGVCYLISIYNRLDRDLTWVGVVASAISPIIAFLPHVRFVLNSPPP